MHVLIVEDDRWLAEAFESVLRSSGHSCKSFPNTQAAMDAIDESAPDVIVLDMLLPGGSGMTLLHELQSYDDTATIPVIVCSSLENTELTYASLQSYGVRRVLHKASLTPQQLGAAIDDAAPR